MNLGKIFSLMADENIDKASVFELVNKIKNMDLQDEENLRSIIRDVSSVANRQITPEMEDYLIERIKTEGIPKALSDIFS